MILIPELNWSQQAAYPILAALQLLPLLGAGLLLYLGERGISSLIGRLVAVLEMGLAIDLYRNFESGRSGFQLAEKLMIFDPLAYHAAADGITVLFVMLSALVVLLLTIYGLVRGLPEPSRLLASILAVEGVLMSLLVSTNLLWFVLASAVEIALVGYLLWHWATSPEKDMMVTRFYQFQGTGILLLLLGVILLGWVHAEATGGDWSFELTALLGMQISPSLASVIFFLLFYGMGIRTPIFPLHGWLPLVAQHGNVAIAPVLLLAIKVGIYGMVRFVFPILPEAVVHWHSFAVAFAAAGVFYAAFLAFLQRDLRSLMAYAVISHTSLLIFGLFSLHAEGFQGSILLSANFGLAMTVMIFVVGLVYRRTRTTMLDQLGGLFDRIPFIGGAFLLGGLAIVGMPGTPGFDAAHLVMEASIDRLGALLTVAVALGNVVAAGFLLWAFQRAFLAPRGEKSKVGVVERALPSEYLVIGSAVLVLLVSGFYMEPWMKLVEAPLHALSERFHPMTDLPLLSLLFLTLPLGAGLAWVLPRQEWVKRMALLTALIDLAITLLIVARFDPSLSGFQLVEQAAWIPTLNIQYLVGVDGISLLFLPATVLLFIGAILASWNTVTTLPRLYYSLLMLLETATLGIFCSLDTMLFFLFWELSLIPLYFLISLWGSGPNRRYAAMKYMLVMIAGGVPLLFGFILLAFGHAGADGVLVFDLPTLLSTPIPAKLQIAVFLLLLLGFAVKVPLFPLHTWLPLVSMEGPAAVTAMLVGIKLGAYGLIRFAIPLAPDAAQNLHWVLATLGAISVMVGAVAALAQTNLRRMLAYASLSHVGLVVMGLASLDLQGLQGAVLQLLTFTLAAGGGFLLISALQHRVGSSDILSLGGAARSMPMLASFFLLFGLAGMGMPGTSGFPAELLILVSTFAHHAGAALAALFAMVLGTAYFLGMYRRAFFGPAQNPVIRDAMDLRPRELAVALVFASLILAAGFFPSIVLDIIKPAGEAWVMRIK